TGVFMQHQGPDLSRKLDSPDSPPEPAEDSSASQESEDLGTAASSRSLGRLLGANLLWFGRVLHKQFEVLLSRRGVGLTPAQARVLLRLECTGPLAQKDLAVMIDVAPPTLGRTLEIMERQGLVRRRRNAGDRRQRVVDLDTAGKEKIPLLFNLFQETEQWLTAGLSLLQVDGLVEELATLRQRLSTHTSSCASMQVEDRESPRRTPRRAGNGRLQ
ncbi:MAG: MarR family winged helix-turn-helix transcriptional regulator, partial [Acidobacteriota bacterium]